jgi:4-amino-4-deoxy-L-arabinose transferase-like glycosyltransferase
MALARESPDAPAARGDAASDERHWLLWLLLIAIVVRIATLGLYPLMDNTEARYAEIARKMIETGNWVTPQFQYGVAFWSKPPLSTWLTAGTYAVLGINEFAARLSSFACCLAVLWITVDLAGSRRVAGLGLRTAVVLFTTPLFFISAGAVMTDAALAVGTTLSMAGFWYAMTRDGRAARVWGYLFFVGLAIGLLAKGPVGVVLTFLPVGLWTLWKGGIGNVWRRLPWISGTLLTVALALPWYLLAESRTPGFLDYFIIGEHWKRYTVTGWKGDMFGTAHARPRGMIWPLAILATLPWCVIWLGMLWQARHRGASQFGVEDRGWRSYLVLWLFASPVFFTFAGNILFTYVLPALPAFALLVGHAWTTVGNGRGRGASTTIAALAIPVLMVLGIAFVVPRVGPEHSQKTLVAQYQALRTAEVERLIYVNEAPQSAEFYASGKVVTVKTLPELDRFLFDGQRDFYALTQSQFDERPDLASRLTPVGRYGRYLLLQDAAPPALPARPAG